MAKKLNTDKQNFILQFILNTRLSNKDDRLGIGDNNDRIVSLADELYDKATKKSMVRDPGTFHG